MRYLITLSFLFSFYSKAQLNISNRTTLPKGYAIKLGYEDDYKTIETENYLYTAYQNYHGPITMIYTRIRKSDMKPIKTFTVKKYEEPIFFKDDFVYIFSMVKDKENQKENEARWKIKVDTYDDMHTLVKSTKFSLPKVSDYPFKPSFRIASSENKTKILINCYNHAFMVIDYEMNLLFSKEYSEKDEVERGFFVDNQGSAYVIQSDARFIAYDAKDGYSSVESRAEISKEMISKVFAANRSDFQFYTEGRLDFFISNKTTHKTSEVFEYRRSFVHFALDPSSKEIIDYKGAMDINNISEVFAELKVTDKPMIIKIPNQFMIAKYKNGNILTVSQSEVGITGAMRTNMDRKRQISFDLKNAKGEMLLSNYYKVTTRGTLPQHGIGMDLGAESLVLIFNVDQNDLQSYLSLKGKDIPFVGYKVATNPKKMVAVMEVLSLEDGSSLYHDVIFKPEVAKEESVAPQTLHVSAEQRTVYMISNGKTPDLVEVALPD